MGTKYPTPFPDFSGLKSMREKRERRELPSASLLDPQSSASRNLSSQEPKFIYTTRYTHGHRKQRISLRIQAKSLGESWVSGFSRLPKVSSTLQEVGILPTLVYFPF